MTHQLQTFNCHCKTCLIQQVTAEHTIANLNPFIYLLLFQFIKSQISELLTLTAMAGLQRSAVSFRRQGSSGFVWDDRFLSEELNKLNNQDQNNSNVNHDADETKDLQLQPAPPLQRTRTSGGARAYRTGKVSPAIEPPSPRLSACGFCAAFGKTPPRDHNKPQRTKPAKHRPR
ncbi:hypothetical protein VNO80_28152 [Phaseolus coccineus]|uniref:MAPK kinase substrate protein n=1 Tax=Phaseolus coccineus TaxID=3886 RepID=A0AAN9LM53_PHACN